MQVAQRGTSDSGITASEYADGPDRYKLGGSSFGTVTVSQSTDSPDGFANSYKVDVTTANGSLSAGSLLEIQQSLEGQDVQAFAKGTSAAKQYSLSFYVKSTKTGTYVAMLQDHDNSRMCCKTYTVSNTNWNRYTLTYPADTTGAFGNDNEKSLSVKFCLVAGTDFTSGTLQTTWGTAANATSRVGQVNFADSTSNDWYVTGLQLEVDHTGSGVATDFEHRSFAQELRLCQRYFQKSFEATVTPAVSVNKCVYTFVRPYSGIYVEAIGNDYVVEMRSQPTLTFYPIQGSGSVGQVSYYDGSWSNVSAAYQTSHSTSKRLVFGINSSSSTTLVQYNYTASSEL
jgi:hypothetical protein